MAQGPFPKFQKSVFLLIPDSPVRKPFLYNLLTVLPVPRKDNTHLTDTTNVMYTLPSDVLLENLNTIWVYFRSFDSLGLWSYSFFFPILFLFPFIFISWRLITLQYCSGFCHTLTWHSCTEQTVILFLGETKQFQNLEDFPGGLPRDRTQVSHIAGRFFTSWATREALPSGSVGKNPPKEGDMGLIPDPGKVPHASEELSLCATTAEAVL